MKKTFIILASCVFLVLALAAGLLFVYENLKDLETQREFIIQAAKEGLSREIQYKRAAFSLRTGPAFTFTDVTVMERDGKAVFLSTERLVLKVAILPLLKKEIVIRDLHFSHPRVVVSRNPSGKWNMGDLLEEKRNVPVSVQGVTIEDGSLAFRDQFTGDEDVDLTLENLNLAVRGMDQGKKTRVDLKSALIQGTKQGWIAAEGTVSPPPKGRSWPDAVLDMRFRVQGLELKFFLPYYRSRAPFESIGATLDMETVINGNWSVFSSSGTMAFKGLKLRYSRVFPEVLAPEQAKCAYDLKRDGDNLTLKKLSVSVDTLEVQGSLDMRGLETKDPLIEARAAISPFSYERYSPYIPYGILPDNVATYIRSHIRAGVFRLFDGKLSGRLSEIRSMNRPQNTHVLNARVGVERGVLTYGDNVPIFRDIKGELIFSGPDFLLKNMSGRFGDAPLVLDGAIKGYCLDAPSTYPFTTTIKPGSPEIAWLMGAETMRKVKIIGSSTLKLAGDGPLDSYRLTGDWDMTRLDYSLGPLVKPGGWSNRLQMTADVQAGELNVRNLLYDLTPISLSGSGRYRFKGGDHVAIAIRSNAFDLKDLSRLMPDAKKFRPEGPVRFRLNGESRPRDWKDIVWKGDVALEGVAFNPMEGIGALKNIRGAVQFMDGDFSTSDLRGMLGQSAFGIRGRLANPENPTADIMFASDFLNPADLGFVNPRGPVRLKDLKGQLVLKADVIQVQSLSAHLNASVLNGHLSWPRHAENPLVDFLLTTPVLELDDILMITGLKKASPGQDKRRWSCQGRVNAGKGKLGALDFTNLSADIAYREPHVTIKAFDFQALGGSLSGSGSININDSNYPVYDFDYRMSDVPASSLLKMANISPGILFGAVSSQGRLMASGTTNEAVKKTVRGTVNIQVEKGVLKEFAILSKVFSILNVSQLLKFRLPDMAKDGMPFTRIRATVSMKDGILSTENAFLRSDAMNMMAVVKADMVKETIDMTLGLQPLQTIDKVVSRIPVLGWILTDKDKRFITVYFEAKGPWKDPDVRAMPVREMALEVLNIFKRVLQLPVKLFTDTGDVL